MVAEHPSGAEPAAEEPEPDRRTSAVRNLVEWVVIVAGALLLALVLKTFVVQVFLIPSDSMLPTLDTGDRVLVEKLTYRWGDIEAGDVVVFDRPEGSGATGIDHLIKRVVATGGQTVSSVDGRLVVDGEPVDEPYLGGAITVDMAPVRVPPDHLWVMGDNRGASQDSRVFGPIAEEAVVGQAVATIWPLDDLGTL